MPSSARSARRRKLELAAKGIRAPFRGFMNWPCSPQEADFVCRKPHFVTILISACLGLEKSSYAQSHRQRLNHHL
jgi:hypothetical protein